MNANIINEFTIAHKLVKMITMQGLIVAIIIIAAPLLKVTSYVYKANCTAATYFTHL